MDLEIIYIPFVSLRPAEYNPRKLSKKEQEQISISLVKFGWAVPGVVNKNPDRFNVIVGMHRRAKITEHIWSEGFYYEGEKHYKIEGVKYENNQVLLPCIYKNLTFEEEKELNIRLNKNSAGWDKQKLLDFFDLETELLDFGFDRIELDLGMGFDEKPEKTKKEPISTLESFEPVAENDTPGASFDTEETELSEEAQEALYHSATPWNEQEVREAAEEELKGPFMVPPFNLVNTSVSYWHRRKELWNTVAGHECLGDPVTAELLARWFTPDKGSMLEIMPKNTNLAMAASLLGFKYNHTLENLLELPESLESSKFEMVYLPYLYGSDSCPNFSAFNVILRNAASLVAVNRFLVVELEEYRNAAGILTDLAAIATNNLLGAGFMLYNKIIVTCQDGEEVNSHFNNYRQMAPGYKTYLVYFIGSLKTIPNIFDSVIE